MIPLTEDRKMFNKESEFRHCTVIKMAIHSSDAQYFISPPIRSAWWSVSLLMIYRITKFNYMTIRVDSHIYYTISRIRKIVHTSLFLSIYIYTR